MLHATLAQDVAPFPNAGAPHTVTGTTLGALVRIFEPGVQIAWFERAPVPAIADYLRTVSHRLGPGRSRLVRADDDLSDLELPDHAGREALLSEIGWLTRVYTDLLGEVSRLAREGRFDYLMCAAGQAVDNRSRNRNHSH